MFGIDTKDWFKIALAVGLIAEAPGEFADFRHSMQPDTTSLVCYDFLTNTEVYAAENVTGLEHNPDSRTWIYTDDQGERWIFTTADTATCWEG